jgi:hypothetical protein
MYNNNNNKPYMWFIAILLAILFFVALDLANAHEDDGWKHTGGGSGMRYGEYLCGLGIYMAFSNAEQTEGRFIVWIHDKWHWKPSKTLKCEELWKNDTDSVRPLRTGR